MLRSLTVMLLSLGASFGFAGRSYGQFDSISDQRMLDSANDYEVWVAEPDTATGWYVVLRYPDGYVDVRGAHATKQAAEDWVDWMNWHTTSLIRHGKSPIIGYQEMSKEPGWQYFGTFPTLAEAEDEAEWFEDFGMLIDIRRVSTLRLSPRLW